MVGKRKAFPSPDMLQFPDLRHELVGKRRQSSSGGRKLCQKCDEGDRIWWRVQLCV